MRSSEIQETSTVFPPPQAWNLLGHATERRRFRPSCHRDIVDSPLGSPSRPAVQNVRPQSTAKDSLLPPPGMNPQRSPLGRVANPSPSPWPGPPFTRGGRVQGFGGVSPVTQVTRDLSLRYNPQMTSPPPASTRAGRESSQPCGQWVGGVRPPHHPFP